MKTGKSPFKCHVLVCRNDRHGERKSCADGNATELYTSLKAEGKKRGWKPQVRISQTSCLGLCEAGPNVLIYPQGIAFQGVELADQNVIIEKIETLLVGN